MTSELRNFYLKYYSANLMKLVLLGNNTIEELEKLATDKFTNITNTFKLAPQCDYGYSGVKFPIEIRFNPSTEKNTIHFIFPIEIDLRKYIESQPFAYIGTLLSYSGKQSLVQKLKSLGYLLSIDFGKSVLNCWVLYEVEMVLSDKGIENYEHVKVKLILKILKMNKFMLLFSKNINFNYVFEFIKIFKFA